MSFNVQCFLSISNTDTCSQSHNYVSDSGIIIFITFIEKGTVRMPKAKRYSIEQIDRARKTLRSLSNKNVGKSRTEVVGELAEEIRQAAEKGYSLRDIRDALAQAGVSLPLTRLRTVLGGEEGKVGMPSSAEYENGMEARGESRPVEPRTEVEPDISTKGGWDDEL